MAQNGNEVNKKIVPAADFGRPPLSCPLGAVRLDVTLCHELENFTPNGSLDGAVQR